MKDYDDIKPWAKRYVFPPKDATQLAFESIPDRGAFESPACAQTDLGRRRVVRSRAD